VTVGTRLFDGEVDYGPRAAPAGGPADGPAQAPTDAPADGPAGGPRLLVIACGAIAREVLAVVRLNRWTNVTLRCLPGKLHNTPAWIAGRVDAKLREARAEGGWDGIFVAYGDCGTGGALDRVLDEHGVERLPGDHCYAFLAGVDDWLAMHDAEPRTFYLTDFLCRHFDRFVVRGLRLDEHPELLGDYFGNYVRVVYLAQTRDPALARRAADAAAYLGLALEVRHTGLGDLRPALERAAAAPRAPEPLPEPLPEPPLGAGDGDRQVPLGRTPPPDRGAPLDKSLATARVGLPKDIHRRRRSRRVGGGGR
jgi:hypothetical protein